MTSPFPWENPRLFGHTDAAEAFMRSMADDRLHHAWLFCGPEGIGKATLAFHCANAVLSGGQQKIGALSETHKSFQLIKGQAHPDLRIIGRPMDDDGIEKAEIPVESIRTLTQFFRLTSAAQNWRIAVIMDAECMNRQAQNALLKILEEPPPRCLVLMTATSAGQMLQTIRSRCRFLSMHPLDEKTIRIGLMRQDKAVPQPVVEQAIKLSQGSLGRALHLIETEGLELHTAFTVLLDKGKQATATDLQNFADQMARKADAARFRLFASFLDEWLQDLIRFMVEPARAAHDISLLQTYAARKPIASWLEVWDKIRQSISACENLHLDRKLTTINCLSAVMHS